MPLFLDMVRKVAVDEPELARQALQGLRRYQAADRPEETRERPIAARKEGASLRACGGSGPPLIMVPSLINPPSILDLDARCSLADRLAAAGRVFLLDWGPAAARRNLDLGGHLEELLLPLLESTGPAVLVGYCLGGTLTLAAARRSSLVRAVVTLASPWHFRAYPVDARHRLHNLWEASQDAAERLEGLPMEVLQAAFWSLDPRRSVLKFARFAHFAAGSEDALRFLAIEDWANGGEPLPLPAARELFEDLFQGDLSGRNLWRGGGLPSCPQLHFTASGDRIVPPGSAPDGQRRSCPAGHVGMVVGRSAAEHLHAPLLSWLEGLHARG